MNAAVPTPRTRQGARHHDEPNHASERIAFCRTHRHASPLAKGSDYRARVGGSRFLEVDPIEGGSANDYDYVSGDPINRKDLEGKADLDALIQKYGGKLTMKQFHKLVALKVIPYYAVTSKLLADKLDDVATAMKWNRLRTEHIQSDAWHNAGGTTARNSYLIAQMNRYLMRAFISRSQKGAYDQWWDRCGVQLVLSHRQGCT